MKRHGPWLLAASMAVLALAAMAAGDDARRSGFDFMSPQTQSLQRDDTLNPGMLWVGQGEDLWRQRAGAAKQSCADCHGDATSSMRGIAARYPRFDEVGRRAIDLGERIQACRQRHQQAPRFAPESNELLALQAYVGLQSRGLPLAPDPDPRLVTSREHGRALFTQRMGQLDFSCAQCHDERAGGRLGGSVIPQAHVGGYPIYRLEWQTMGSLQRRLRGCLTGVRTEPFPYASQELVDLELYLVDRAKGMTVETPAVRP